MPNLTIYSAMSSPHVYFGMALPQVIQPDRRSDVSGQELVFYKPAHNNWPESDKFSIKNAPLLKSLERCLMARNKNCSADSLSFFNHDLSTARVYDTKVQWTRIAAGAV